MTRLLGALLLIAMTYAPAMASVTTYYSWCGPTNGSTVHHYVAEAQLSGGEWVPIPGDLLTNEITLELEFNVPFSIRVAVVSEINGEMVQGKWSPPAVVYTPEGPGIACRPERD